jgi:hypothetical protein
MSTSLKREVYMAFPRGEQARNFKDHTGIRYARLLVVAPIHRRKPSGKKVVDWLCRCECGNESRQSAADLQSGKAKSCGCLRREVTIARFTTHGASKTPEFRVWAEMMARCECATNDSFYNYGGRGISVCSRWREAFEAFSADMGPRPSAKHTIERLNNAGNYEPSNCVWAVRKVQNRNKRNIRLSPAIVAAARQERRSGGNIAAMARRLGLSRHTLGNAARGQSWADG